MSRLLVIPTLALALMSGCGGCRDRSHSPPLDYDYLATGDAEARGEVGEVVIEATASTGDASFYRAGVTIYRWESLWGHDTMRDAKARFLSRTSPGAGLIEFTWPAQDGLTAPTAAAWGSWLDQHYATITSELLAADGAVLLQISGPPKWASSRPDQDTGVLNGDGPRIWARTSPDAGDGTYPAWSSGFAHIASWLLERYPDEVAQGRIIIAYAMEFDNHELYADMREYAPAYNAAARAVRGVSREIVVAGGGRLDAHAIKYQPEEHSSTAPVLATWLEDCAELECPLDLVVGHNFSLLPTPWVSNDSVARSAHADIAAPIRELLDEHGYEDVGVMLTDHTSWEFKDLTERHAWLSSEHDTHYRAAHLGASLVAMRREGFSGHTIGTLFEQAGQGDDFVGDWGLFTTTGIAKPSFHAAAMASQLAAGELVDVNEPTSTHPFIRIDAARTSDKLLVYITRFVPDTQFGFLLVEAFAARYLRMFQSPDVLLAALRATQNDAAEKLLAVLDSRDLSSLDNPPAELIELFDDYFALVDLARSAHDRVAIEIDVSAHSIAGAPLLSRVDATTSNSFYHCVQAGADCSNPVGINDGPTNLITIEVPSDTFDASTRRVRLEMGRYQVDLLEFELD